MEYNSELDKNLDSLFAINASVRVVLTTQYTTEGRICTADIIPFNDINQKIATGTGSNWDETLQNIRPHTQ